MVMKAKYNIADKILSNWENIMSMALTSSINAIAFTDMEGNIIYVNDAFLKMWGYNSAGEVIGIHATEFWHDKSKAKSIINELITNNKSTNELIGKRKDGLYVQRFKEIIEEGKGTQFEDLVEFYGKKQWFLINIELVRDLNNEIIGGSYR